MKRLIRLTDGKHVGDYTDAWVPPAESDIAQGLAAGTFSFTPVPQEEQRAERAKQRALIIRQELQALDLKRIRPLAEGETEILAALNAKVVQLRKELAAL